MTDELKDLSRQSLRDAIYHLACCWDMLRDVEEALTTDDHEVTIMTDDIEEITGECWPPSSAFAISNEQLDELMATMVAEAAAPC
jgi:hypothetical protein